MLNPFALLSFAVACLCALIVACDTVRHRQPSPLLRAAWIVAALWGGIAVAAAYFAFGRERRIPPLRRRARDRASVWRGHRTLMRERPRWQQVLLLTLLTGAGCAPVLLVVAAVGSLRFPAGWAIGFPLAVLAGTALRGAASRNFRGRRDAVPKAAAGWLPATAWTAAAAALFAIAGTPTAAWVSWRIAMWAGFVCALAVQALLCSWLRQASGQTARDIRS